MKRQLRQIVNAIATNRKGQTSPIVPILIAVIGMVVLGGWWYMRSSTKVALRIHGSNTIGAELGPAMVEAWLKSLGATDIKTKELKKEESQIVASVPGESGPLVVEIFAHGSGTAFVDLAAGQCDIGMASRKIESKEAAATVKLGDLTSINGEHVIGLDGVAVIINKTNPVDNLSKDQLARIFSGEASDWSVISNAFSGPIKLYARDDKSGTFDTFNSLVLKPRTIAKSAGRIEDSKELSAKVSDDAHAIGFIGLPYVLNAKPVAVYETETRNGRRISTRPLLPTKLTVATEDYPLSRRLFFYTPANPENRWTRKLVDFAISKAGQDIVGQNGFVSQTPTLETKDVHCEGCPARYQELTENRNRLNLDFRFLSGKTALDNKAVVDINKVIDLLFDLKYNSKGVVVLGFADNHGAADKNLQISQDRASAVADQFRSRGLTPEVIQGMGSEMPVASNDLPEGREKNRRVEIWVRP